jgi:oxygen-independent coproporphyrinogen-3 oxidase
MQKCLYCDFLSIPGATLEQQKRYLAALLREMDLYRNSSDAYRVTSVFVGGGTPSCLSEGMLAVIFQRIYEVWEVASDAELTIECNPGTLSREKLSEYHACGINRLSLGLQSAENAELKRIGRIHNYEQFVANYMLARELDFSNINVDIMSALPGQDLASYGRTLAKVLELQPEHISAYSLIVEEGTPLSESEELLSMLPSQKLDRRMYQYTKNVLESMGYERYEFSNYAKKGYECRHNIGYWTGASYLGLGLGASSYYEGMRFHNMTGLEAYERLLLASSDDIEGSKPLSDDMEYRNPHSDGRILNKLREEVIPDTLRSRMEEFMFLGLRLTKGVSEDDFYTRFGYRMEDIYGDVLFRYAGQGLLKREQSRVALTDAGIDVSNYILADFLLEDELEEKAANTLNKE